ncbi:unnamed protein product [Gadus morhua 'NCC']
MSRGPDGAGAVQRLSPPLGSISLGPVSTATPPSRRGCDPPPGFVRSQEEEGASRRPPWQRNTSPGK